MFEYSWVVAGAHGGRTHPGHNVPRNGVEVREAHRDSFAPIMCIDIESIEQTGCCNPYDLYLKNLMLLNSGVFNAV